MVKEGKSIYVSLAHRYWRDDWTSERNQSVYGDDASQEGMGGNLRLEAFIQNPLIEPSRELEAGLAQLKSLIDHRSLFNDLPEFSLRPSTLENIALFLARSLFAQVLPDGARWHSLRVWQGEGLWVEIRPEAAAVVLGIKCSDLWLTLRGVCDAESGLAYNRREVFQAVQQAYSSFAQTAAPDRAEWLFNHLQSRLKSLESVTVDLTRQNYLKLSTGT